MKRKTPKSIQESNAELCYFPKKMTFPCTELHYLYHPNIWWNSNNISQLLMLSYLVLELFPKTTITPMPVSGTEF